MLTRFNHQVLRGVGGVLFLLLTFWQGATWGEKADLELERVRLNLTTLLPNIAIETVQTTPVPGLYEVTIGPRIVYVTGDGRYLFQGELIDLELRESLTSGRLESLKMAAVEALGEANMLIFKPQKTQHTVTVFTDIDCAFCRKLHENMDQYLAQGIKIRYLFYPRSGQNSASYIKAVSVWCSKDRNAALTAVKAGHSIKQNYCQHPVQKHMLLAEQLGVSSAPVLILENGELLPSYLPADQLKAVLVNRRKQEKLDNPTAVAD